MNGKRGSVPYARVIVVNTTPVEKSHMGVHVI